MLKTRVISAAIAIAFIVPIILFSQLWLKIVSLVAIMIGLNEFFNICLKNQRPILTQINLTLGSVFGLSLIFFYEFHFFLLLFSLMVLTFANYLFFEKDLNRVPASVGLSLLGFLYIAFFFSHLPLLGELEKGPYLIFWVMVATFFGDTGAYFTGKSIGKHKLIPRVSPGKTWEGFFGQIAFALLGSFLFQSIFLRSDYTWIDALVLGGLCGIFGPLGDLSESMMKRAYNVKDSGSIMPGHGGLLDRIDGLLFTTPAAYYFFLHTKF